MVCPRKAISLTSVALGLAIAPPDFAQTPEPITPAPTTPAPAKPAPAQPPAQAPKAGQEADVFGEDVTLTEMSIIFMKGTADWDKAYETLVDAFKTVYAFLERQGVKPAGPAMTIYIDTDDNGFRYQAAVPIAEAPKNPPRGDLAIGKSPVGKAMKFVHRGSYDALDETYEAITNFLDEKKLEAKDMFVEEYVTDLLKTPKDKLVVHVFVPIK